MKQRVHFERFQYEMENDPYSDFSWEALKAIFQYIEEYEESTGEEWEFDRVDIRCRFTEYESEKEAIEEANYDPTGWNDGTFLKLPSGGFVVCEG